MKVKKSKRNRSKLSSISFLGALKPKIQKAKKNLATKFEEATTPLESRLISNISE